MLLLNLCRNILHSHVNDWAICRACRYKTIAYENGMNLAWFNRGLSLNHSDPEGEMKKMKQKRTVLTMLMFAALGVTEAAQAITVMPSPPGASTTNNNFTMLDYLGGYVGSHGNVNFTWDGTYNTSVAGSTSNATLSSSSEFFGYTWTAHDVKVYSAGAYNIPTPGYTYNLVVPTGQVGMSMLFDWGVNYNIGVVQLCGMNQAFTGAGPANGSIWDCASIDGDGDGISGIAMHTGPFAGLSANFNINGLTAPVPVPAAAWLLGSGLVGLGSLARKRKTR